MAEIEDGLAGVRAYLLELSPPARALLLGEFERRVASGEAVLETSVVLQELRRLSGGCDFGPAFQGLVLDPLHPFLVDDDPARRHPGRITCAALARLWDWLEYDLLPDDMAEFAARAGEALATGETGTADALARGLQDRIASTLRAAFVEDDETSGCGALARIATPHAREDAATLRWVLRGRVNLAKLDAALPESLDGLTPDEAETAIALIEQAAQPRELFPFALVLLMNRLPRPWQVLRLAVFVVGAPIASRVAETSYGITIPMLLAELDRLLSELKRAVLAGDAAASIAPLRAIDAIVNGMRAEIEIPVASTLGRQLAALQEEAGALGKSMLAGLEPPATLPHVPLSA